MCTVSYIPTGVQEFVLTSNRDETPTRQPLGIFYDQEKGLLYPKEPSKGGTWIAASKQQQLLCILNGAFEKHKHQPPYKRSRGLLVLDFFSYDNATDFFNHYDFKGIEPFTLIIYDQGRLFELRWDEEKAHVKELDPKEAYIWSSSTLYSPNIKALRQEWFESWWKPNPNKKEILNFHKTAGIGDPENDLIMSRYEGVVQTVSITQVAFDQHKFEMGYNDLVNHHHYLEQLEQS